MYPQILYEIGSKLNNTLQNNNNTNPALYLGLFIASIAVVITTAYFFGIELKEMKREREIKRYKSI